MVSYVSVLIKEVTSGRIMFKDHECRKCVG